MSLISHRRFEIIPQSNACLVVNNGLGVTKAQNHDFNGGSFVWIERYRGFACSLIVLDEL